MVDVFFWVQHLLGIGHLTRAATLVRAMRRAGLEVTLASGGLPVPGIDLAGAELVQLEPLQSDGISFSRLLDAAGRPVDDGFKARRAAALVDAFTARQPRLLMLEMFPFGRRQMRFELDPLIAAAARQRPASPLVASVRDILVQAPKPERLDEMLERAAAFALILIHGDPAVVPFSATFPQSVRLGDRLIETGYVVDSPAAGAAAAGGPGAGEIVVSAGGGRVGEQLLEIAIEAAARLGPGPRWRILTGPHLPGARFAALAERSRPGLVVERARSDFRELLGLCALSISQGGYNTVLEVLAAGCRAIVVPYAGGLETEQTLRCRVLAERGLLQVMDERTLDAPGLAAAVRERLAGPPPQGRRPRMDGAPETVRQLRRLLDAAARPGPG